MRICWQTMLSYNGQEWPCTGNAPCRECHSVMWGWQDSVTWLGPVNGMQGHIYESSFWEGRIVNDMRRNMNDKNMVYSISQKLVGVLLMNEGTKPSVHKCMNRHTLTRQYYSVSVHYIMPLSATPPLYTDPQTRSSRSWRPTMCSWSPGDRWMWADSTRSWCTCLSSLSTTSGSSLRSRLPLGPPLWG